jgi:butyryl-CoA dehydrogenase
VEDGANLLYKIIDDIEFIHSAFPEKDSIEQAEELKEKAKAFIKENRDKIEIFENKAEENPSYFDWNIVKSGAKFNFLSLIIPKEFGGKGIKALPYSVFIEEICSETAGVGNIFGAHALGMTPILLSPYLFSFTNIIKEVVEREKKGEPILFAFGLTEPTGGSDVQQDEDWLKKAKMTTKAQKVKDGYILNGRKVFISNGSVAKYITVFAQTSSPDKMMCLLVNSEMKGFSIGRVEDKMGQKTCHAAELVFEDVFVPDDMVVIPEGSAPFINRVILSTTRAPVGAIATGIAKGAIKKVIEIVEDKDEYFALKISEAISKLIMARMLWITSCTIIDKEGSMKLSQNPVVKLIAKIFSKINSLDQNLTRKLGRKLGDRMKDVFFNVLSKNLKKIESLSSIAKFSSTQLSFEVCNICMELLGEKSADKSLKIERFLRDVRLTQIYETTNEVNKIILWKNLFA